MCINNNEIILPQQYIHEFNNILIIFEIFLTNKEKVIFVFTYATGIHIYSVRRFGIEDQHYISFIVKTLLLNRTEDILIHILAITSFFKVQLLLIMHCIKSRDEYVCNIDCSSLYRTLAMPLFEL